MTTNAYIEAALSKNMRRSLTHIFSGLDTNVIIVRNTVWNYRNQLEIFLYENTRTS